jgi:hypothetical protein
VRGYADLNVLVRSHPGWIGLVRYNLALKRLAVAARQAPPKIGGDLGLTTLPPAEAGVMVPPEPALQAERQRLEAVQTDQAERLRRRQAESRRLQIARERLVWEHEASTQYTKSADAAQAAYLQSVRRLVAEGGSRRLNLDLQIKALNKIVAGWDASTPPTPKLIRAKKALAAKQVELAALDEATRQSGAQARQARADAFVAAQAQTEETRLAAQDAGEAQALQARLTSEQEALVRQERTLSIASAPPAGALGAENLPLTAGPVTLSPGVERSLRQTRTQLLAQRARWVAFLYSDTRAAVQDAAAQKHWIVTFRGPVRGERDLTAPLAHLLTQQVWKS